MRNHLRLICFSLGFCLTLLAGAFHAVQSAPNGLQWQSLGLSGQTIFALAVHPTDAQTLFAGLEQKGVYRTTDDGAHWTALTEGMGTVDVLSLAIDPQAPQTLYAGTAQNGAFRSQDGGEHWTALSLSSPFLNEWLVDPQTPSTLYVLAYHTLVKSLDGGEHWQGCGQGVTPMSLSDVEMNPQNAQELYLGAMTGTVYHTSDGCASWTSALVTTDGVSALAAHPQINGWVYAATPKGEVYLSQDGGKNWSHWGSLPQQTAIHVLETHPTLPSMLIAGTLTHGVYCSLDSGRTWTAINAGLTNLVIHALIASPLDPNYWYAGTDDGVFALVFPTFTPQIYLPWVARAP